MGYGGDQLDLSNTLAHTNTITDHLGKEMPRSKDPRNYGKLYDNLTILMDSGQPEIRLKTSGRNAIYIRNNFYALINAWKHTAETIHKHKGLEESYKLQRTEEALHKEEVLRQYLVVIDPRPDPELESVELRFIYRDMDPRVADVADQLESLVDSTDAVDILTARREDSRRTKDILEGSSMSMTPVDGRKVIEEWEKLAKPGHVSVEGYDTTGVTEADIAALSADPTDRTDLTDLITDSNQAASIPSNPMEEALKQADKLRDKEREQSKKIT